MQSGRVLKCDAINDLALICVPKDSVEIASISLIRTQLNQAFIAEVFQLQSVCSLLSPQQTAL